MRILLTGASGQLGRELLRSLCRHGEIVPVVRSTSFLPSGYPARIADFTHPERLRAVVREVDPKVIVNAAAYTAVDAAEVNRDVAMAVNSTAPGILAEEGARLGALMIHYSTDYVFNGTGQQAWCEDDFPEPVNFYGMSKFSGEEAIRATGASHLILRTSWVYGIHGANFVKKILELNSTRAEIAVVDDQVGAPTSARFLAELTSELIRLTVCDPHFSAQHYGTYHTTCAGETSWFGFACEIFRQVQELASQVPIPKVRAIRSSNYPSRAKRPENSRLNTKKLAQRFMITTPHWKDELCDGLDQIVAQHRLETSISMSN